MIQVTTAFYSNTSVCLWQTPFTLSSSCTSDGKVAEGGFGSSYLLCGQPQSPGDEEQHWEVQADERSDRGGLPGQRDWEWETLGEEGGRVSLWMRERNGVAGGILYSSIPRYNVVKSINCSGFPVYIPNNAEGKTQTKYILPSRLFYLGQDWSIGSISIRGMGRSSLLQIEYIIQLNVSAQEKYFGDVSVETQPWP